MSSSKSNSQQFLAQLDAEERKPDESIFDFVARVISSTAKPKPRAKSTTGRRNQGAQWYETIEELEKRQDEVGPLCHYIGSRNSVEGKFCGATATNTDVATCPDEYRCTQCAKKKGKAGAKAGKKAAVVTDVRTPDRLPTTTTVRTSAYRPPMPDFIAEECDPDHYKVAKNDKIAGFVFDCSGSTSVCVGKIDVDDIDAIPEDILLDIKTHIQELSTVEAGVLKNIYALAYRKPGTTATKPRSLRPQVSDDEDDDDSKIPTPPRNGITSKLSALRAKFPKT
jgi:hypothetical protein